MKPTSIEDEVIAFVADFTRYPIAKISRTTTLFGDIGICGDDGDEILTAFLDRFQVDMSGCRPVHFGSEGIFPPNPFRWISQVWKAPQTGHVTLERRAGLVPITIQDLVDAAISRRWTFDYEKRANQPTEPTSVSAPRCHSRLI